MEQIYGLRFNTCGNSGNVQYQYFKCDCIFGNHLKIILFRAGKLDYGLSLPDASLNMVD